MNKAHPLKRSKEIFTQEICVEICLCNRIAESELSQQSEFESISIVIWFATAWRRIQNLQSP